LENNINKNNNFDHKIYLDNKNSIINEHISNETKDKSPNNDNNNNNDLNNYSNHIPQNFISNPRQQ